MPNDNAVGADLSTITTDLSGVESVVDRGISLNDVANGTIRKVSNNSSFETVLTVSGPCFVGGQLITSTLSGATAEMRMFDGSVSDANKISHAKAGANESIMCGANPCNVLDTLNVQLKSDGTNDVEGLIWILSAKPVSNPTIEANHTATLENAFSSSNNPDESLIEFRGPPGNGNEVSAIFEFDISSLPFGRSVSVATFKMDVAEFGGYNEADSIGLYGILVDWEHNQATWDDRLTGTAWNTPGLGSGTDRESSSRATAQGPWADFDVIEMDVTDLVQEWINYTLTNHGLYIRCESGWNQFKTLGIVGITTPSGQGVPRIEITFD